MRESHYNKSRTPGIRLQPNTVRHSPESWKLWRINLVFASAAYETVALRRPADLSMNESELINPEEESWQ
jgi:hypothetical protein